MKPEASVWRKAARRALRGIATGRRETHTSDGTDPRPGSTWHRRHPGSFGICPCHPSRGAA